MKLNNNHNSNTNKAEHCPTCGCPPGVLVGNMCPDPWHKAPAPADTPAPHEIKGDCPPFKCSCGKVIASTAEAHGHIASAIRGHATPAANVHQTPESLDKPEEMSTNPVPHQSKPAPSTPPELPENGANPQPEPTAESAEQEALEDFKKNIDFHSALSMKIPVGTAERAQLYGAFNQTIQALIAQAKAEGRREELEYLLNERRYVQYQDGAKGYGIAVPAAKLYDRLAELKEATDEA